MDKYDIKALLKDLNQMLLTQICFYEGINKLDESDKNNIEKLNQCYLTIKMITDSIKQD